jgi:hypothetical protein
MKMPMTSLALLLQRVGGHRSPHATATQIWKTTTRVVQWVLAHFRGDYPFSSNGADDAGIGITRPAGGVSPPNSPSMQRTWRAAVAVHLLARTSSRVIHSVRTMPLACRSHRAAKAKRGQSDILHKRRRANLSKQDKYTPWCVG